MKQLITLLLSLYVSTTFATHYQQSDSVFKTELVAFYTQIDTTEGRLTQVKTRVTYHPQLQIVQQIVISRSAPLSQIPASWTKKTRNLAVNAPNTFESANDQAYLRSLEREQFYAINASTPANSSTISSPQIDRLNGQSWQQERLYSPQTRDKNNKLLDHHKWATKQPQVMF